MHSYLVYLSRNKLYTAINVFGMSFALAFCLLAMSFVVKQVYTDSHHVKSDNIYLMTTDQGCISSYWMNRYLMQQFPDRIESAASVATELANITANGKETNNTVLLADSLFFDIFTYDITDGDISKFAHNDLCAVISQEFAHETFGDENPIGKTISTSGYKTPNNTLNRWEFNYTVVAIMERPQNTIFNSDIILSAREKMLLNDDGDGPAMRGAMSSITTFLVRDGVDIDKLEEDIDSYFKQTWYIYDFGLFNNIKIEKFRDAYFGGGYGEMFPHGNMPFIILISVLAICLAILAARNYVSLTLVQTTDRTREMAIRRLLGTSHFMIVVRLTTEALFLEFVSMTLAVLVAGAFESKACEVCNYQFELFETFHWYHYLAILLFCLLIGIFSSITPSIVIVRNRAVDVLRNYSKNKSRSGYISIASQYAICFSLLVPTICIWLQLQYQLNADMGYKTDDMVIMRHGLSDRNTVDSLYLRIKGLDCVEKIGASSFFPLTTRERFCIPIGDEMCKLGVVVGDSTLYSMLGIKQIKHYSDTVIAKHWNDTQTDYTDAINIDQSAADMIGICDTNYFYNYMLSDTHMHLTVNSTYSNIRIGSVLDDCNHMLLINRNTKHQKMFIIKTHGNHKVALKSIANVFHEVCSDAKLPEGNDFIYIDDLKTGIYSVSRRVFEVSSAFSILCILISILGLYGSTLITIEKQRRKIAIWRICGGSFKMIITFLLRMPLRTMAIAFVLCIPLAYYLCEFWLNHFSYRIETPYWVFGTVFAGVLITTCVTVVAVGYAVICRNPAKNLL